jgi:hypothetical protein
MEITEGNIREAHWSVAVGLKSYFYPLPPPPPPPHDVACAVQKFNNVY